MLGEMFSVLGVLVEALVMLILVKIANNTKKWFKM
jgi:ACR3 family arsenite efflux pump ArsB